jgi:hypothetical protein
MSYLDSKVKVKGQGKILIHCKDGNKRFISNVFYVPGMRSNILRLGQLLERGYMIFVKERILYLRDQDNRLLAQIEMTKKYMYKLKLINVQARCLKACVDDKIWL